MTRVSSRVKGKRARQGMFTIEGIATFVAVLAVAIALITALNTKVTSIGTTMNSNVDAAVTEMAAIPITVR